MSAFRIDNPEKVARCRPVAKPALHFVGELIEIPEPPILRGFQSLGDGATADEHCQRDEFCFLDGDSSDDVVATGDDQSRRRRCRQIGMFFAAYGRRILMDGKPQLREFQARHGKPQATPLLTSRCQTWPGAGPRPSKGTVSSIATKIQNDSFRSSR